MLVRSLLSNVHTQCNDRTRRSGQTLPLRAAIFIPKLCMVYQRNGFDIVRLYSIASARRYESKTPVIGCDPYSIVVGDFNRDVTKWPQVGFLDIMNYLISSLSDNELLDIQPVCIHE